MSEKNVASPVVPMDTSGGNQSSRGAWGGKLEFVLTCIGFAVGLGNVWRFPYLCYKNGGAGFLIPYVLMLVFIGLPLFFFELCFGQFASLGPIAIWTVSPLFKGVGVAMVIVCSYIVIYYAVIIAWCLFYFFASMTSKLPWMDCNNDWNTDACIDDYNAANFTSNMTVRTPSEEYYNERVLQLSSGLEESGTVVWQLCLLLLLVWVIVFLVLLKGINSVGKAAYFVSLFPYVLLTIMLGRGASLPGARKGVEYYMKPDFSRLGDAETWSDAATQIFYSLGCCMGGLIAMASFNKFKNNVLRDALLIPIINCATSLYAGFVIFSVLGYMAERKNVDVRDVASDGPGLVFVVYPEALATMPVAPLWSILFFFMMCTLGFSSQFTMVESICTSIIDEFPGTLRTGRRPLIFRTVFCICAFLFGIPMVTEGGMYLFTVVDDYCAGYPLLIVGLIELIVLAWVYPYSRFASDIEMMLGKKPNIFWRVCWCGLSPLIIVAVIVFKGIQQSPLTYEDYAYPGWGNALAWLIVAFPLSVIVLNMLYFWCINGGFEVVRKTSRPTSKWGPALPENRTGRYATGSPFTEYNSKTATANGSASNGYVPTCDRGVVSSMNGHILQNGISTRNRKDEKEAFYPGVRTVADDVEPPHYTAIIGENFNQSKEHFGVANGMQNRAFEDDSLSTAL